jgi:hypothetical protein
MIGAVFFHYSTSINNQLNNLFASITWLVFLCCYIQVFKTYYLVTTNARFHHDHDNRTHAALPYWLAESIATAIGSVVFIPGVTIAYFMVSPSRCISNLTLAIAIYPDAPAWPHLRLYLAGAVHAVPVRRGWCPLCHTLFQGRRLCRCGDAVPHGGAVSLHHWLSH